MGPMDLLQCPGVLLQVWKILEVAVVAQIIYICDGAAAAADDDDDDDGIVNCDGTARN